MKKYYRMHVSVSPLTPKEIAPVLATIGKEWSKPERVKQIPVGNRMFLEAAAESYLCRGEGESEFAERMTVAIWKKLGRFVKVTIDAVYLEEPPHDSYEFGEFDYQRLVGAV